jgi:hypothetical protein
VSVQANKYSNRTYCTKCGMGNRDDGFCIPSCEPDEPSVSYSASRPGQRFKPDGVTGGGILYVTKLVHRNGFRPTIKTVEIHKTPLGAK